MYLNTKIAKEIIKEISQVIDKDLNIMDETGLILASTDEKRVNTFHEAARILIQSKDKQLIVSHDGEYEGCKMGTNLPVHFASEIVGVIGITGDPKETMKYGLILKKMTEMILNESFKVFQDYGSKRGENLLINDLVHGNIGRHQYEIEEKMKKYGINLNGQYAVAVIKNNTKIRNTDNTILNKVKKERMEKLIIDKISNSNIHVMFDGENYVAICTGGSEEIYNDMKKKINTFFDSSNISLLCAVGSAYDDYMDIYRSFNEAENIVLYFKDREKGIYLFDTIVLDYMLNQLPTMHKENLKRQIFSGCSNEEKEEYIEFILSYFNANGSLNVLSEKYFFHKNTIQYKIQKIHKVTGYDLRKARDLFVLYVAAICD